MNDKKKGIIKRSLTSLFDVRRWVAWDILVGSGKNIISMAKDMFTMPKKKPATKETFEQAVKRLNLTEEEIVQRMQVHLHLTIVYLFMAFALFIYLVYSLVKSHFLASFVCTILDILVFVYALRTHLIYIQMKHRKMCHTFQEWFDFTFKAKVEK